jgi:NarL family two-component system response regulator YdfI
MSAIPTLILHRSASFRSGLATAIDNTMFSVRDGVAIDSWLGEDPPRVVVVGNGDETTILAKRRPGTTVVVLLPTLELDGYRQALAAGADGVAHIDSQPAIIADVIRAAVIGEVIIPAEVARQLAGRPRSLQPNLSSEERSLLQRISEGATVVQLADEFYLAERSVRRRLQNIYVKLGVGGRAEAVKLAGQLGLVD